ncbi:MAG: ABC transporter permease [Gammaproteobacteria bacterium]|nr:ABC transporter permease [Gammaproteobacteria bacterium]
MKYLQFVWMNLFRKPLRTTLTFFSLFVAFILFVILGSVTVIFNSDIEMEGGENRLQVSAKYSIIDDLPGSYVQEIQALPDVELVTHATWFGAYYQDERNMIPLFPIEPDTYFAVMDELTISDEDYERMLSVRRGMLAPETMAEEYGWQVGDLIPIGAQIYPMNDGNMTWEFEFAGTYSAGQDFGAILVNYDYFDEARQFGRGAIGWLIVKVIDSDRLTDIATQIDKMYVNSSDPTRSAPEAEAFRQFMNQYGNIGLMMTGILSAVFFTILLLTGNTMSQSFRERIPELAVLKTLGFTDTRVSIFVLIEAVLLCLIPALVSVGIAIPLGSVVGVLLESMPFGFPFAIQASTLYSAIGIAALLGCLIGLIPAITAKRLSIVDALRP